MNGAALTDSQRSILAGDQGKGVAMAMRIVTEAARLLNAEKLVPIQSAHIDSGLYHGDAGVLFAEKLVEHNAKVAVRSTLNVGALDLTGCSQVHLNEHQAQMARRQNRAYRTMGCEPSWTCAPYQAGHRPEAGTDVAWGESNAVVFCNSVLGARTNRYGDLLDIACAITGFAPYCGLHVPENRMATIVFDAGGIIRSFPDSETIWPVLGSILGRETGDAIAVVTGIDKSPGEDALKAFGAAAASTGAVGLFHMEGFTPEAPDKETALGGRNPERTIVVTKQMYDAARIRLSTASDPGKIDAVAIGSPHLSLEEFERLSGLIGNRELNVSFYACTGRHVLSQLEETGMRSSLEDSGVTIVADTCVVVTPIMRELSDGVLMTNSGKFAHYAPGNTGYGVLYGSLSECVESAIAGKPVFHE